MINLKESIIEHVQIDTNANCGSRCWFCPVKYYKRPHSTLMTNETFESILVQLNAGVVQRQEH